MTGDVVNEEVTQLFVSVVDSAPTPFADRVLSPSITSPLTNLLASVKYADTLLTVPASTKTALVP